MLGLLINVFIIFLILAVIWYVLTLFPLPAPFPLVIRVVFMLIALIIVIDLLLSIGGAGWQPLGFYHYR